jgi:5-methylcytosine-specific restriction endonuclease McrA
MCTVYRSETVQSQKMICTLCGQQMVGCHSTLPAHRRAHRLTRLAAVRKKERERYQRSDACRAYLRQWKAENPERVDGYRRNWKNNHAEDVLDATRLRRARRRKAGGIITKRERRRLFRRYHGRCAYCRIRHADTLDHVIPLARGGRHTIGNALPACRTCNLSKGAKLLVQWRYARQLVLV